MKTCRELGITKAERDALCRVRDGLASGQYQHVSCYSKNGFPKNGFNMMAPHLLSTRGCGTLGCIAGWVGRELNSDPRDFAMKLKVDALCYPTIGGKENFWDGVTPAQAATAIDNFLRTGKPMWSRVIPAAQRS